MLRLRQPLPRNLPVDVPRETLERLELFAGLILHWNRRLNLIARRDEPNLWGRHVIDSLQFLPLIPPHVRSALDIGSGAGFPGLILAIATGLPFLLVESDKRKAAFLQEAARLTGATAAVQAERIEDVTCRVELITSRATAKLTRLLDWTEPRLAAGGMCLFAKGRGAALEQAAAEPFWDMHVESFPSVTASDAVVLRISQLRRR